MGDSKGRHKLLDTLAEYYTNRMSVEDLKQSTYDSTYDQLNTLPTLYLNGLISGISGQILREAGATSMVGEGGTQEDGREGTTGGQEEETMRGTEEEG